ncbi:MAG: fibronectin type III domain-containing protein, partial [Thermoplasmata archaeon]
GETSGSETFHMEIQNVLYYNDTDVINGIRYYYKVSTKTTFGEGSQSNEADDIPLGLSSAPQNLQATGGDSNITLSWEAPDLDGGSPITKYRIYKSTIQGEEVLFDEIEDFLEYTDTYVNDDATYYYTVSAVNLVGVGPQSNEANAMTLIVPPTPSTPSVPHNLQAQSGDSYVYLTWDVPTLDGGSTITNYRVYRGVEEDDLEVIALIGNVPHYNDTNVTKDVVYYYKVSAVNLIGEGPLSDDVNASYQEESITEVPPGDEDGESMWWLWILIIIIIVIVVLVFLFLYWRDRKKEEQAPPKQGPPGSQ